jgi:hypothetical protein
MDRPDLLAISGLALVLATLPSLVGQTPAPEKLQIQILNGARVYHPATLATGDKCERTKVGIVRSLRVFEAIPEYKEIKKRDLDPDSAEYLLYMKKASDRFKNAVSRTVTRGSYDLIAEKGAVSVKEKKNLTDITAEVIRNL